MTAPTAPPTATPSAGTLALRSDQTQFTATQRAALAQIGVADATDADLSVFLHYSQRTGLDPFSRQIYMIKRQGKQTIQTGIDGFRIIADRTGKYRGKVSTEWCGTDGVWTTAWLGGKDHPPHAARVTVKHADHDGPESAVCLYDEFVARKYGGEVNEQWTVRPAHMLAKCAEAGALRAAFPHDLGGLFTDDEMAAADNPVAGPDIPRVVDGETVTPNGTAINWQAMIDERVAVQAKDPGAAADALKSLLAQARQMIPKDTATLNKIASAWNAARKATPEAPPETKPARDPAQPRMATPKQKGAIASLIGKGGVSGKDAMHVIVARMLDTHGDFITTLNVLTLDEASKVYEQLAAWEKDATLADAVVALIPSEDDPVWDARAAAVEAEAGEK